MKIAVRKETFPGEKRVSLSPKGCASLLKSGHHITLEAGAGVGAGFRNEEYQKAGVEITDNLEALLSHANVVTHVRAIGANPNHGRAGLELHPEGQTVIGLCDALSSPVSAQVYSELGVSSFALELMPRTTKAQSMDVLSSQANLIGYYGVLRAATHLPKIFPMLMTAAGTTKPARVLVLGAGVAGLQAIATAKRLGAVVHAYDVRPAAVEQIQSLGAKAVPLTLPEKPVTESGGYASAVDEETLRFQQQQLAKFVSESDVVVCTAAVPGKRAPVLISEEMVRSMRPGSVVMDLSVETGGNCALTEPDAITDCEGVLVIGETNLASQIAHHASEMFSQNVVSFLQHLYPNGSNGVLSAAQLEDEIVRGTLLTLDYAVKHPRVLEIFSEILSAQFEAQKVGNL